MFSFLTTFENNSHKLYKITKDHVDLKNVRINSFLIENKQNDMNK